MKIESTKNSTTIILCGRGKCCPKITKHKSAKEEHITISDDYNFIEMTHHIILVYFVDVFAKNNLKI